jgi:hypothetical protein
MIQGHFSGPAEEFPTSGQQTNTHELLWKFRSTTVYICAQHGGFFLG